MRGDRTLAFAPRVAALLVSVLLASLVTVSVLPGQTSVVAAQGSVQLEWLGHLFYRLTSPEGVVVVTSPWLSNPDGPVALDELRRTDIILIPNSHHEDFGGFDDLGNPLEVARVSGATVVAPAPLGLWLIEQGLAPGQFRRAGIGDRFTLQNLGLTIIPSHTRPDAPVLNVARRELERLGLDRLMFVPALRSVYEY